METAARVYQRLIAVLLLLAVFVPLSAAAATFMIDWGAPRPAPTAGSVASASPTATPATGAVEPAADQQAPALSVPNLWPVAQGLGIALLGWVILSLLLNGIATARSIHLSQHDELLLRITEVQERSKRLAVLAERLQRWGATQNPVQDLTDAADRITTVGVTIKKLADEGIACLKACGPETDGLPWVLGWGYADAWRKIHRAEEALMEVESVPDLLEDVYHDYRRLHGSSLDPNGLLLQDLRLAARAIEPAMEAYLQDPPSTLSPRLDRTATPGFAGELAYPGERRILTRIRQAINSYREDEWAGVLRQRNGYMRTVGFVGVVTFIMLALGIAAVLPHQAIFAGVMFWVIGGATGALNQLRVAGGVKATVEDYGLSEIRKGGTFVLAGLAAVLGVVLISVLPVILGTALTATTGATSAPAVPGWDRIFDLTPVNAVWAAVFGLAPDSVFAQLQKAEQHLDNLKSSESASP